MDMIPADNHISQLVTLQGSGVYFEPKFKIHRPLKSSEYTLPLDSFRASGADSDWFYKASKSGGFIVSSNNTLAQKDLQKQKKGDKKKEYTISLINQIQSTFGLSVEETATVCGVTRKTVYNWKDGDQPSKSKFKRLIEAAFIAESWESSSLSSERALLEQPVYNGRSIMQLLTDKHLDKNAILFAGSTMQFDSIKNAASIEDPFA